MNNNKLYIEDQGVQFYISIDRQLTEEEKIKQSLYSPYKYYWVNFFTGNDKNYMRVMNIIDTVYPRAYKYICCETEIKIRL